MTAICAVGDCENLYIPWVLAHREYPQQPGPPSQPHKPRKKREDTFQLGGGGWCVCGLSVVAWMRAFSFDLIGPRHEVHQQSENSQVPRSEVPASLATFGDLDFFLRNVRPGRNSDQGHRGYIWFQGIRWHRLFLRDADVCWLLLTEGILTPPH